MCHKLLTNRFTVRNLLDSTAHSPCSVLYGTLCITVAKSATGSLQPCLEETADCHKNILKKTGSPLYEPKNYPNSLRFLQDRLKCSLPKLRAMFEQKSRMQGHHATSNIPACIACDLICTALKAFMNTYGRPKS